MKLCENAIAELREFIQKRSQDSDITETRHESGGAKWPLGGRGNIVLSSDVGVELGNPRDESVACIVWTEFQRSVKDGIITVIGPDIPRSIGQSLPFGKVVLVQLKDFDPDNMYERYREMERIRYGLDLKGYMLRAVSQYQREWSRVSMEALNTGFTFKVLGGSLIDRFKEFEYVEAVEVVFVTTSSQHVRDIREISLSVQRMVAAMYKMIEETSFDCEDCEYNDVCSEVSELRKIKQIVRGREVNSVTT